MELRGANLLARKYMCIWVMPLISNVTVEQKQFLKKKNF